MLETSGRLLRLLGLLQGRREWAGGELGERLGVSARTVRRDVGKLRALGYAVEAVGGVGGGYRLAAGSAVPPLLLDDEEAVAVAVGLRTAAGSSVARIAETSVRALAKLDQGLPSRLRHRISALNSAVVTLPALGPKVDPAVLTAVAAAVRDRERLRFDYVAYDGTESVRDVEPYRLIHDGHRWYLLAWDPARADWRRFRADRLTPRVPTGPRFTPRELPVPEQDLGTHHAEAVTTDQYRHRAVLTVHAPAHEVAAEVPPTIGTVEPVDPHTTTLRVGSDNLDQLAVWTATFGFRYTIEDPPELIEKARLLAERLSHAARGRA